MNDPELNDLLRRWADGEATADELTALIRLGTADPAVRQRIARHAAVHGLLALALGDPADRQRFTARVTEAIVPDAGGFSQRVVAAIATRPGEAFRWWRGPLLAGAALLAFGLGLGLAVPGRAAPVGRILASTAAAWRTPPPAGPLTTGTRLDLAQGLVEVDLAGRGSLILEGPADLTLTGPLGAFLRRGRVVMRATVAGHGYRIETPGGSLVDLGTQFGIEVATDGATQAHVLEGSIEAVGRDGRRAVLTPAEAVRLGPAGLTPIPTDADAFYTALPPRGATDPVRLHWSLDEGRGDVAQAETRGLVGGDAAFHLRQDSGGHPPAWIPGRHGQALAFDGRGAYAESAFPGIAGTGARTVACWVRIPRDFTAREGFAVVSWGHPRPGMQGAVWQISINPLERNGPVGRIRVGTSNGLLVGTTDLRDDAWHHVGVVMYGGDRPAIGTHVLVFVDGELESLTRRTLHPINTNIAAGGHGVWLGRNIMYQSSVDPFGDGAYLRGAVDEVVIVGEALDQQAIRRLREGFPP